MRDLIAEMERQNSFEQRHFEPWEWFTPLSDADIDFIALRLWGEYPSGDVNRRFALAILIERWLVMPRSQAGDILRDWIIELKRCAR